jgi:3-methyladenine DNA glycosylase AlkD
MTKQQKIKDVNILIWSRAGLTQEEFDSWIKKQNNWIKACNRFIENHSVDYLIDFLAEAWKGIK